jgi:predicted GH43/DUF377 family glycosyl hydrolase
MMVGLVLCVPGLVVAQTEWVSDPVDPVLGPGDPGAWDGGNRYPLEVIEVDGTYHLYFNGQPEGAPFLLEYDIGHATSADGVTWEMDPANPVLTRGAEDDWDDGALFGVAMVHDGSGFRMWYAGCDGEYCRTGLASSPDGSSWTKHQDNPLIDVGSTGSFDAYLVNPHSVVVSDGVYRMWFLGSPTSPFTGAPSWVIGYAESEDGLSWTKHPVPVLGPDPGWEARFVYTASVHFDGLQYHMWYTGSASSHAAIGYAVSSDGIEWTKYLSNPVMDEVGSGGSEYAQVLRNEAAGTYEMWYRDHTADSIRRAVSDCCSTVFVTIIPAAAFAAGAEGSFYETDLELNNASSTAVEFKLSWLPRGESNVDPTMSELFTLAEGASVRYRNVLAEVFDLEADAFGALTIEASSPDLLAMARIANTPQEKAAGTFGQAIPAVRLEDLTGLQERRRLIFATEDADMRFNVGCLNVSTTATRVMFELFSADGEPLGTENLVLMPWGNEQLNRIFDAYQPVNGYVDVWSMLPTGRIYCYGSLLDNVTSDPTTVPPM